MDSASIPQLIAKRGNFSMIPNEVWEMKLTANAIRLWGYLYSQSVQYNPRYDQISEDTGIRRPSIKKALAELQARGMLEIEKTTFKNANSYRITSPKNWGSSNETVTTKNQSSSNETVTASSNETVTASSNESVTTLLLYNTKLNYKTKLQEERASIPNDMSKDILPIDNKFAREWVGWLSVRGSHHAKSAKISSYEADLATLRRKHGLTYAMLPEIKKLVSQSEFWSKLLITPKSLLKRWKNKVLAVDQLKDELNKIHKKGTPKHGEALFGESAVNELMHSVYGQERRENGHGII